MSNGIFWYSCFAVRLENVFHYGAEVTHQEEDFHKAYTKLILMLK